MSGEDALPTASVVRYVASDARPPPWTTLHRCQTRRASLIEASSVCNNRDGPLDPERKRMFMAMKREVLRLGGYEQELFVSQTPELWGLADCVIEVRHFNAQPGSRTDGPPARALEP